jgi:putative holliday junction resolvase
MPVLDVEAFAAAVPKIGRLIGLDLGEKRIGVALSDSLQSIATPFETLSRLQFGRTADALLALAAKEDASGFVIGLPLNMDGSRGPSAQSAEAFARNLSQRDPRPIMLWDERLSTAAVTRTLLDADASRRRRAEVVDKMAASYILQGALDRLRVQRGG